MADSLQLEYTIVDAFTSHPFSGNPAAVVILPRGVALSDHTMQRMAREFNLSDTAFVEPTDSSSEFYLRWFTPGGEVPLCGHATLATAAILSVPDEVKFRTRYAGEITARRLDDGRIEESFPVGLAEEITDLAFKTNLAFTLRRAFALTKAPDVKWVGVPPPDTPYAGYLLVHISEDIDIANLCVNSEILAAELKPYGLQIITNMPSHAPSGVHFVSRVFAAAEGVNEDPVCGSAHCVLAPYWAKIHSMENKPLHARQVSARGGFLEVQWDVVGRRVFLRGNTALAARGVVFAPRDDKNVTV